MGQRAYLVTVLVIDHEEMGLQSIRDLLESDDHLMATAVSAKVADIGEWHDQHPLNMVSMTASDLAGHDWHATWAAGHPVQVDPNHGID